MNSSRFVTLSRLIAAAGLVVASAAAQAGGNGNGNVYWSVNVDAPTAGNGRLSTSFSNTRRGMYREPQQVVYAPQPVLVQPGRVYYREPQYDDRPRWGRHHHHRHGYVARRVARNVHNGLARMHENMADFHASRAEAWSGGGRSEWYGRDERRDGYYGR